jgi:hypothetical protein
MKVTLSAQGRQPHVTVCLAGVLNLHVGQNDADQAKWDAVKEHLVTKAMLASGDLVLGAGPAQDQSVGLPYAVVDDDPAAASAKSMKLVDRDAPAPAARGDVPKPVEWSPALVAAMSAREAVLTVAKLDAEQVNALLAIEDRKTVLEAIEKRLEALQG